MAADDPFGTWLKLTRELQVEAFGRDEQALEKDDALRADTVSLNFKDLVVELGEMMGEYPGHKTWVVDRSVFYRQAFLGEAVDVLHFFANILTALKFTDEELNAAYLAKVDKNYERMASGTYDGVSSKCPICKREMLEIYNDSGVVAYNCPQHGRVENVPSVQSADHDGAPHRSL